MWGGGEAALRAFSGKKKEIHDLMLRRRRSHRHGHAQPDRDAVLPPCRRRVLPVQPHVLALLLPQRQHQLNGVLRTERRWVVPLHWRAGRLLYLLTATIAAATVATTAAAATITTLGTTSFATTGAASTDALAAATLSAAGAASAFAAAPVAASADGTTSGATGSAAAAATAAALIPAVAAATVAARAVAAAALHTAAAAALTGGSD